jgi:hypothetical protein
MEHIEKLKQKFLEAREYALKNAHKVPPFPKKPILEIVVVREEIVPKSRLWIPGAYAVEKELIGYVEYDKQIRRYGYTSNITWTETVTVKEPLYRVKYKDQSEESWRKLKEYGVNVERWYNELDEKMRVGLIALAVEKYLKLEPSSNEWAKKIADILEGNCWLEDLALTDPETLWDIVVQIRREQSKVNLNESSR